MTVTRDYWLGKLFFDLQNSVAAVEYRADREKVLACYPLSADVRTAVLNDDVNFLARLVNPYLLRFYFQSAGMSDADFIRRLRTGRAAREVVQHG